MTILSEDPTYLVGGFILLAGAFLVILYFSQQGKYLFYAGIALGLAILVFVIELYWVTDNERIEQTVYDIQQAVLNSDAEGVLIHMAPDVQFIHGNATVSADQTRAMIRANLSHSRFDYVRISGLRTSSGHQSRRGHAEFRVFTKGHQGSPAGGAGHDTGVTNWSLGFQEIEPGIWKVNRISPIGLPTEFLPLPHS